MNNRIDAQQAAHFLALAEQASQEIFGHNSAEWVDRLEGEYDRLQATLEWFIEHGDAQQGLRLANALYNFWYIRRSHLGEGREWLAKLLALPTALSNPATRARALYFAGLLAFRQGDAPVSRALIEEGFQISSESGDKDGMAVGLAQLARLALRAGDHEGVRRHAEESLAIRRGLGDVPGTLGPLHLLAASARMQGDYERAAQLYAETSALYRQQGDEEGVAGEHFNLGHVTLRQGNVELAGKHFQESIDFYRGRGNESMLAASLAGLAGVAIALEKPERAARLLGAAEAINRKLGVILDPDDRLEYERDLAAAGASLGENNFGAAFAAGQAMSLDEAIAFALNRG